MLEGPETDIELLKEHKLDPTTHLIQSLRGVASNASMIIAAYHYYLNSEYLIHEKRSEMNESQYACEYYKFYAFQSDLFIRLRKTCETNKKSLALGAIEYFLTEENIETLKKYIKSNRRSISPIFDKRIRYIKTLAKDLSTPNQNINRSSSSLIQRVGLIRRMANKSIAHLTLDDYQVHSEDIHEVFLGVMSCSCAIQEIMGDLACPSDFEYVENLVCEGAYDENARSVQKFIPDIKLILKLT